LDLSVIIVNWNDKDHLRDCLKSVYEESQGLSFEVVVVDNASSDGSSGMVKEEFPQAILMENDENAGFARANNQAIDKSRGKYVCLLNPDSVVLDGALEKMMDFMEQHPQVGVSGGKTLNPKGKVLFFRSARRFPTPFSKFCTDVHLDRIFSRWGLFGDFSMAGWDRNDEREVDVISGAFMFVRKEAVMEAGLLLAEDVDWCRRIKQKNWKIRFNPRAEIIHFGGGSIDRIKRTRLENDIRSHLLYFRKHHGWFSAFSFRFFASLANLVKAVYWIARFFFVKNRRLALANAVSHFRAVFFSLTVSIDTKGH
jgi:GT2 family glycosyltransferase